MDYKKLKSYAKKVAKKLKPENYKFKFYCDFKDGSTLIFKNCYIQQGSEKIMFVFTNTYGNFIFLIDSMIYMEINDIPYYSDEDGFIHLIKDDNYLLS